MTQTIELPVEVYEKLEKQAQARRATIAETVTQILEEIQAAQMTALWDSLKTRGLLAERKPAPTTNDEPFQPIQVQGKPLSEVIIEERR